MAWTEKQQEAIYTRGNNIIVSAGAGSGKTAVLSERILDYCKQGNDIRRVLVLTFTNAAAREMKERIRKKLIENQLNDAAECIDAAYITTFDAYSLALVKKYYYKLGLSKNISIMDGALISVKRKEIITQLFDKLYKEENTRFFAYLKKYTKQDDKDVMSIVEGLCNKLDLIIDFNSFVDQYEKEYLSIEKFTRIVDEFETLTKEEVQEFILKLKELYILSLEDKACEKLSVSIEALLHDLELARGYDSYYSIINAYAFPRMSSKASIRTKEEKEICNTALKSLKTTIFSKYEKKEDMMKELQSISSDVLFLLDLCKQVSFSLMEYKKSVLAFDYSDIAKFAIELVRDHLEVQKELKEYYNEILVDEYQDTSDLQEAFLSEIENHNLYMVGDIKQSIYRFRNANPYIFKHKYDVYSKNLGGVKIDLTHNFRSRSEVLEDINFIFNQLMTPSCGDANYILDHQMRYGLKSYDSFKQDMKYKMDVLRYNMTEEYEGYSQEEIEAFITAQTILNTIKQNPKVFKNGKFESINYSDFAILVDKAKSFITFKQIFEYLGIPLAIEADLDLKESILPKLFSNILLLLHKQKTHTYDIVYKHALASLARSFLYEYTDDEVYRLVVECETMGIIGDLKELSYMEDISMAELFFEICKKMQVYEKLSKIGDVDNSVVVLEYIYKILTMLPKVSMPYDEIVEYLSTIFDSDMKLPYRLESNQANSVRIMTIHKSKGLEFPFCIFPLLSSRFNQEEVRASIGYHPSYGIYVPYAEEGKSDTILKTLISKQIQRADISERVRLFYVALTRAREKMICILPYKDKVNTNPAKFSSFYEMLFYCSGIESYISEIDLTSYPISLNYKKKKMEDMNLGDKESLTYKSYTLPKELEHAKISKRMMKLPDKKTKESIALGLKFHSILESIDFKNPSIEHIEMNDFMRDTLKRVLAHPIFDKIHEAKTYHEHEFYYTKDHQEYHGIIDLLVIYDDHVDIIDYKLSNAEHKEYIHQLEVYKNYVETLCEKRIDLYLLSILKAEVKKIEI